MPGRGVSNGGLDAYRARLAREVPQIVMDGATRCTQTAQQRAPYKTGSLRRSIQMRILGTGHAIVGILGGPASAYARIQDRGGHTPPHTITAKHKQALSWPGAQHPVKAVQHPGSAIPGNQYFTSSVIDAVQWMRMRYRQVLKP